MKHDASRLLYDKYFSLNDCEVEIYLKNNTKILGTVAGYFYGEPDTKDAFILKWHLVDTKTLFNTDAFDQAKGSYILSSEISWVHCHTDQSIIEFDDFITKLSL